MGEKIKKLSNATKIFIAMVLGAVVGIVVGEPAAQLQFIGDIWLNIMKMFLVPIVVCMLVKGICQMESPKEFGRIGTGFIIAYAGTTVIACALASAITSFLGVGYGFAFEKASEEVELAAIPTFVEALKSIFSGNIFKTFAEANVIQIIVISCFIGIGILQLPKEKRDPVKNWFFSMADLMVSLVRIALALAPIGVFALMASSMGKYGLSVLFAIAKLLLTFYGICIVHVMLVDCLPLWLITGMKPTVFIRKILPTFAVASSTCSSNATIPVSMEVATKDLDVQESVAGLGVTLGSTIHKDGTAMLCCVVMIFSAQAMGIPFTLGHIFNLLFVVLMVTSANGGLPSGGVMNMIMIGTAMGIPLDIVVIVSGFYRLFDIVTTPVNCFGDMSVTVIMDRLEKRRVMNRKNS